MYVKYKIESSIRLFIYICEINDYKRGFMTWTFWETALWAIFYVRTHQACILEPTWFPLDLSPFPAFRWCVGDLATLLKRKPPCPHQMLCWTEITGYECANYVDNYLANLMTCFFSSCTCKFCTHIVWYYYRACFLDTKS